MRLLKSIFCLFSLLLALGTARAEETYLLWQVMDTDEKPRPPGQLVEEINGSGWKYINEIVSRPDGYKVNGLRIHVTGPDGVDDYLTMLNEDASPGGTYYDVMWDDETVDIDGIQLGPSWADVSNYADSAYSFVMELGYYDEDIDWLVMAVSPTETWDAIEQFTASSPIYSQADPWRPAFVVPEPTSGILVLFGLAALSLRRRRRI